MKVLIPPLPFPLQEVPIKLVDRILLKCMGEAAEQTDSIFFRSAQTIRT